MLGVMSGPGLFSIAVIGLLAGAVAHGVVGRRRSLFVSLLVGLGGALAGVLVGGGLGLAIAGLPAFAAAALAGSVTLLALVALLPKR